MINLIPNEQKKKMVRGFYRRFAVLCLFSVGLSVLIGAAVMIPSFFLTLTKQDLVSKKLEVQKNESAPLPDQGAVTTIKDLNNKLSVVERAEANKFSVSQKVINAVVFEKVAGIKITDISYQSDPKQGKSIGIKGIAPSREVLLLFRQALSDEAVFKKVDLPISNFVKGSNIEFSLNLTIS